MTSCKASFAENPLCTDIGATSNSIGIPVVHQRAEQPTLAGDDGLGQATCRGGMGCFIESCLPLLCSGLSIGVTLGSTSISCQLTEGEAIWNGSLSDSLFCLCPEAPF